MPAQHDDRTVQGSAPGGRKAYQAPQLCCYGDVGAITQTIANMGPGDSTGMNKTA